MNYLKTKDAPTLDYSESVADARRKVRSFATEVADIAVAELNRLHGDKSGGGTRAVIYTFSMKEILDFVEEALVARRDRYGFA